MPNDVYANGNAVACKAGDGKVVAASPDVCLSPPSPPAGPVPVPYPASSFARDLINGSRTVKIGGQSIAVRDQSFFSTSPLGNEAATRSFGAGVVSHQITGKTCFVAWSMDVMVEGRNLPRHLDLTTSNHGSQPGNTPPSPDLDKANVSVSKGEPCAHEWEEMKRKTPDETKAKNVENAAELRRKPSKAQQACGPEFENKAIDANMDKLKIQATSLEYRCKKCGAVQEVDILGQSQVAEMKSRTSKGVKNAGEQCRNLMSIQQQLFGAGSQPLAKVDGSRSDTAESQAIYKRRGFALEVL